MTKYESFKNVESWLRSIKSLSTKQYTIFIVGNKADQEKERVVSKKLALKYAHHNEIHFHEVSVKNPNTMLELLKKITSYMLQKRSGKPISLINLTPNQEKSCNECSLI